LLEETVMKLSSMNAAISIVLALAVGGCGSGDDKTDGATNAEPEEVQIELFSWWVNPGEAEALQVLMDLNKQSFPHERIYNRAADSGPNAVQELSSRLVGNDPPDVFQQNAHDMRKFLAENPGKIQMLDEIFSAEELTDVVVEEVLEDVSVDGHIYSMPVNIHRENSLFYNKQIFADHDLEPPTTLAEFFDVCETLKEAGVTPVATSYQGWVQRIMFNSLAMGMMGAEEFGDQWNARKPLDPAMLADAIDVLNRVLTEYSNVPPSSSFGWTQAADMVHEGEAAMFFHGDWAKGYFTQLGWTPNTDFGVVGAPGASDMFWYGVDVFALPTGAAHPKEALDFLSTVASIDGQVGFNRVKGSSPMRLDAPSSRLDPMGQDVLADLQNAAVRSLVRDRGPWDDGLGAFAVSRDKDALIQAYLNNPPQ
jgi:glucose/mannose transport system substrate-binding protein